MVVAGEFRYTSRMDGHMARIESSAADGSRCLARRSPCSSTQSAIGHIPIACSPINYAPGDKARQIVFIVIFLFLLAAAGLLARLNYRRGKGDRQGSFRIALVVFVLQMLLWVCYEHFVPAVGTVGMLILAVSSSLFMAAMVWTLYMALEPYVRKFWPQTIISWSRILTGKIRDPLVGRDVLFGVLLGLTWIVIFEAPIASCCASASRIRFHRPIT